MAVTSGYLLMFCPAAAHAQGGVPLWTNRYDAPASGGEVALAIAVDSSGNVFATGGSATIKYSGAGLPLWTNRYNGGVENPIALDSSGNVFVTGPWGEYGTIKYSSAGVPLWTNRYNGPGNGSGSPRAIALDSSGNVFVTGSSYNGSDLNSSDYATVAYSNSGVPLWTNRYDGPANGDDVARAIAVGSSGNVFVTGISANTCCPADSHSYVTIAYSNGGVPLWTNSYNDGLAHAIAVDSVGNVFVTGQAFNGSNYGFTTIKYSPTGEAFWTRSYNGPGNDGNATAIAVDRSGNVFVTGPSWNGSNYDFATIKYSTDGEPLWTRRYSGPANMDDVSLSIAVDSSGDVFVTGNSGAHPTHDYATIAYSSGGMPLWTNLYNGPGNGDDLAYAIAVDNSGSVFVTGRSTGSDGLNSYVTIKYSSSVPPPRLDFQLLSNQLVLSWTNVGFNLQSAPAIPGTFSNISGATSPYTSALTGPQQYFRLRGN